MSDEFSSCRHFECRNIVGIINQSDYRLELFQCYECLHFKLNDNLNYIIQILSFKLKK
jgi:hypothetical protein